VKSNDRVTTIRNDAQNYSKYHIQQQYDETTTARREKRYEEDNQNAKEPRAPDPKPEEPPVIELLPPPKDSTACKYWKKLFHSVMIARRSSMWLAGRYGNE
jgi:hypothetical protein